MAFSGFKPPVKKVVLQNEGFVVELWPELGGAITRFDHKTGGGFRPLFRAAREQERYIAPDLSCWPLVPYSNRIMDGRFSCNGQAYQLDLNVEGHPHALHGFGWQRPWQVAEQSSTMCRLVLDHVPDGDWPFSCAAEQVVELHENGLSITSSTLNTGSVDMPVGVGVHPYVMRPAGTRIQANVDGVWLTDENVMPTQRINLPPEWDLRSGAMLDGVFMDNCFDGLSGSVRVLWPDQASLEICGSPNLSYLVVYNPPEENYVCVEPVSHMTDAVNRAAAGQSHTGHQILKAGEKAACRHDFLFHPAGLK